MNEGRVLEKSEMKKRAYEMNKFEMIERLYDAKKPLEEFINDTDNRNLETMHQVHMELSEMLRTVNLRLMEDSLDIIGDLNSGLDKK